MASYPLQNYKGNTVPLWLPNDGSINVSTINASTITTDTLGVFPSSNTGFSINGTSNSLNVLEVAPAGGTITNFQVLDNSNGSTIMYAANGIASANNGWFQNYLTQDLAGNTTLEGSVRILSTVAGTSGGVQLVGEDTTYLNVGDGVTAGRSNVALRTQFIEPNEADLQHFVGGQLQSQIGFVGGAGNFSSITMISGGSNSMGVGVAGISLNPGSNLPVVLNSGYINVNNLALSNVSSINSIPYPSITTIGWTTSPVVVPAGSTAVMFTVPTIPGKTYRVTYQAAFQAAAAVASSEYLQQIGSGNLPGDGASAGNVNASFMGIAPNTPGLLGAANGSYGCIFTAADTEWNMDAVLTAGFNQNVTIVGGVTYVERLT